MPENHDRDRKFTPEELSAHNGAAGRPTYIAFEGKVYDVSGSGLWAGGQHMGQHRAGGDLTGEFPEAPHGEENVLRMPPVGRLIPSAQARGRSPQERAFYVMAYVNLSMALLIVLIVALWRWW